MHFPTGLPGFAPAYLPGVAAFMLALAGMAATRRAEAWWPAVATAAAMLGWMVATPLPRTWAMPRAMSDHLVVPAATALLGALALPWARGRLQGWLGAAVLGVSAWWLASANVARGEFWRVWFGTLAVAWVLRMTGARTAWGGVAVGATLLGGTIVGPVSLVWSGVTAVLVGAWLGVAVLRPGAVAGVVVLAAGVVAVELGTGGLVRGRAGFMDLVCALAMVAPAASAGLQRLGARRLGRFAGVAGLAGTVVVSVGLAWLAGRLTHL